MMEEGKLRAFGGLIVRLQMKGDLSREETRDAYQQIWRGEQPELHQGAFIAALRAKGETLDEILGVTDSHNDEWSRHIHDQVRAEEPHLGIVGVGMDTLKTVNVSSGAAVIAAACGVTVHKVGAPGMTGVSGSADVFALLGLDPDVEVSAAYRAAEQTRLGFTSAVGRALHRTGIFRVLSQMRCGTTIHVGGPLGFHSGERHKIIGVPEPKMTRMVVEAMKQLGYHRALAPCGGSTEHAGRFMDELSTVGPSHVAELHDDGTITEYDVRPEDAGIPSARYEDIAAAPTREENVHLLGRVLAGRQGGAVADLLALNAAACLKLMGKVTTLGDGVAKAREALSSGAALEQLRAAIRAQNADPAAGLARLDAVLAGK